jgi:hypothetical protein
MLRTYTFEATVLVAFTLFVAVIVPLGRPLVREVVVICLSTTWFTTILLADLWAAGAVGFVAAALFRAGGER